MFLFKPKKPQLSVGTVLRRICDLTTHMMPTAEEDRLESRCQRTVPILLCPWEGDAPRVDRVAFALTKDISDNGLALTLPQPFDAERVVVGLWIPAANSFPWYLLGQLRSRFAIGGGYWQVGLQLTEVANEDFDIDLIPLRAFADQLLPGEEETSSAR